MNPIFYTASRIAGLILVILNSAIGIPGSMSAQSNDTISYVTSIPPLAMILREIVGDRGSVISLLQPGSSPHTYDPKPSDVATIEASDGFFYIHDSLDGWAAIFGHENTIEVLKMVPDEWLLAMDIQGHESHSHSYGEGEHDDYPDSHFWMDPLTVKAILPTLVLVMSETDPGGADIYDANAERFSGELDSLHEKVSDRLAPYTGEAVLLFHPSLKYFLTRYNLVLAGTIEPFAGREPTPRYLVELIEKIDQYNVKAIFTEPQLPGSAGETLSEETGLPLYIVDPLGGGEGRRTYEDLILYNTQVFQDAFGS
ncbi:zinc ABC transporter substrate-binding protein [bacterium]|nr:zinc ABC transporter substrate-binding protein [bacterium]